MNLDCWETETCYWYIWDPAIQGGGIAKIMALSEPNRIAYCTIETLGDCSSSNPDDFGWGWGTPIFIEPGGGGTGGDPPGDPVIPYLGANLTLNAEQTTWLSTHVERAREIYNYLLSTTQVDASTIALSHIKVMMNDIDYLNFVIQHSSTGDYNKIWWEDDSWLQNPNNFNLDIDGPEFEHIHLTLQELALIKKHPIEAGIIRLNISTALMYTQMFYGNPYAVNDKADAFRHAFFHAINVADLFSEEAIIRQFADAHESEVPIELALEKKMDLFNNNVGITYGASVSWTTSLTYMAAEIYTKLQNGELRYLTPTNWIISPAHDANRDKIRDCISCTNGIIETTDIKPTNQ